jgi:hypothetical protein
VSLDSFVMPSQSIGSEFGDFCGREGRVFPLEAGIHVA